MKGVLQTLVTIIALKGSTFPVTDGNHLIPMYMYTEPLSTPTPYPHSIPTAIKVRKLRLYIMGTNMATT